VAIDGYLVDSQTGERRLAPCAVEGEEGEITCGAPVTPWYDGPFWFGQHALLDGEVFERGRHMTYYVERCSRCGVDLAHVMGEVNLPDYYDTAYWSTKHMTFVIKEGQAVGELV